jgi:hypothetical protein
MEALEALEALNLTAQANSQRLLETVRALTAHFLVAICEGWSYHLRTKDSVTKTISMCHKYHIA